MATAGLLGKSNKLMAVGIDQEREKKLGEKNSKKSGRRMGNGRKENETESEIKTHHGRLAPDGAS